MQKRIAQIDEKLCEVTETRMILTIDFGVKIERRRRNGMMKLVPKFDVSADAEKWRCFFYDGIGAYTQVDVDKVKANV